MEARLVAQLLVVGMVGSDARRVEKLDHAGIRQRIKVAAEEELSVGWIRLVVAGPERVALLRQLFQLVHQHHRLHQLDIAILRIPMDVRRAHEERLMDLRGIRPDSCCGDQSR